MRRIAVVAALCVLTTILWAGMSWAGVCKSYKWDPITEAEWALAPDSASDIFDAVVIFQRVGADDKKIQKYKFYRTIYTRIRILANSGREWADVDVPLFDADQKVEKISARTVLRDGTEIELTEDNIFEKEVVKTNEVKVKRRAFSIPGVTDDCIVEYYIKIRMTSPTEEWVLQQDIPVLEAEMLWTMAELVGSMTAEDLKQIRKYFTPNYFWINARVRPTIERIPEGDSPKKLRFTFKNVPAYESVPYSVPDKALKMKLFCYYSTDQPYSTYWGEQSLDVARWYEKFADKDKKAKELVKQWEGLATEEEKIAAAYCWVHDSILNLTYLDYRDDKGEIAETKEIKTCDDILKHRYGSRTRISYLFCRLLTLMDIPAKPIFAKDRYDDLFVREAKYWQMDQSLVVVDHARGQRFYAPGNPYTPCGMVPWYCEGIEGLMCGQAEYLTVVPFSDYTKTSMDYDYAFQFNDDLEPIGKLVAGWTGHAGRYIRMDLYDEDSSDFVSLLEDRMDDVLPAAEFDSLLARNADTHDDTVWVTANLSYPGLMPVSGRIMLKPFELMTSMDNPFVDPDREVGIMFRFAHCLTESASFILPQGYFLEALPENERFDNGVGFCRTSYSQAGDTLRVDRTFGLKAAFIATQDYSKVQDLFRARVDFSSRIAVLTETPPATMGSN